MGTLCQLCGEDSHWKRDCPYGVPDPKIPRYFNLSSDKLSILKAADLEAVYNCCKAKGALATATGDRAGAIERVFSVARHKMAQSTKSQ